MDRPHLAWPVQFGPAGFLSVEQDSPEDVASCAAVILSWPLGTHPSDPGFGVAEQAFLQGGANLAELRQAILDSEPRAAELELTADEDALAAFVSQVAVSFSSSEPAP